MQHFTVEQANRPLPLVRRIVEDIVDQHRRWRETIVELDLVSQTVGPEALRGEELVRQARDLSRELDAYQRELRDLGIQLKDPRLGLIDFPSEIGGGKAVLFLVAGGGGGPGLSGGKAGRPGRDTPT